MEVSCGTWIDALICAGEAAPLNRARIVKTSFCSFGRVLCRSSSFW